MALIYRAMWRDDRPDLLDAGPDVTSDWIKTKRRRTYANLWVPAPGEAPAVDGTCTVARSDAEIDGARAVRLRLTEEREIPLGTETWITTAHFLRSDEEGWVWIDLESTSSDVYRQRPDRVAPGLVGKLLGAESADTGRNGLRSTAQRVVADEVEELLSWLGDHERQVPVVVFSVDQTLTGQEYSARVRETARRLAGCVDVRMLVNESQERFNNATAPLDLDVHSGAARLYLPSLDLEAPKAWRHRYVRSRSLSPEPRRAANQIGRLLLDRAVARRPPSLYTQQLRVALDSQFADQTDWQALAEEAELKAEALQEQVEQLADQAEQAWLDATVSETDATNLRARLRHLRSLFREAGFSPEVHEAAIVQDLAKLDFLSCADAVHAARGLPGLEIPPDAERDLDRIDALPNSERIAQRIYKHLEALSAYAEEGGAGFLVWCKTSGSDFIINPDHVAMSESDEVKGNKRFRDARIFPISKAVDPSGEQFMEAHTKPVEGGSMQVPRIYFWDGTNHSTGVVHVGFVGPHDLVPNTKSN